MTGRAERYAAQSPLKSVPVSTRFQSGVTLCRMVKIFEAVEKTSHLYERPIFVHVSLS